jgi:hypothetical protein
MSVFRQLGPLRGQLRHSRAPSKCARQSAFRRQVKTVQITEALAQVTGDSFTVTVVAVAPGSTKPQASDELDFGSLHVLTYE